MSYTSDKGKKYNNCHTSKKKAQGQIAAIEAESVNMQLKEAQQAKFGPYEIKWTGDQLMFYVNGKLQKAIDVDANSFGMSDFKKTVKKIAAMKKMEDELPFSIMAEGEEINEKLDFIDDEEAAMDYEDLPDKDIDNDGDEDDSDKYLHHKLGTTAKKTESVNESYVVIDPRGNARPVGSKIQGDRFVKGRKGHYVILAKNAMKARRAIEKAGGKATSRKIQDLMYDLRFENTDLQESTYKYKDDLMKAVRKMYRGAISIKKGDYLQIGVNDKKQAAKVQMLIQKYNKLKGLNLKAKYHLQKADKDPKFNVNLHRITILESSLTEGFATWKMQFAPMKLSGVDLDPKKVYTVKARSTVEAIKKAAKQAGLSGNDWMATQTHKLVKVG